MEWSKSYNSIWRVFKVNRDTWEDGEELLKVDSVSVTRTADGSLLESGSMDVSDSFEDGYYRVVLTAEQDSSVERVEVCTLLFEATGGMYDRGSRTISASGHSVLRPAATERLASGSFAHASADGAEYVGRLLRDAINAPVSVDGSFTLNEYVVHEPGSTVLDACWAVLNAGGFVMQIDGHGTVHVLEAPTEPTLVLDSYNARLLIPGVEYSMDVSSVPNRYTAYLGTKSVTVVNDNPSSPVSTVSRGFAVDEIDMDAMPVNGETLEDYAGRMLRSLSAVSADRTYSREFAPGVLPYSVVKASLPSVGLDGDMRVLSQDLECSHGIKVTERSVKEVRLWNI